MACNLMKLCLSLCRMLRVVLLVSVACLGLVEGYGSGAPTDACGDMVPQHHTPAQNSRSPYTVRAAATKTPGLALVTITGPEAFKGFLVQCRVGDQPVGKFINPPSNVKLVDCAGGKAVGSLVHLYCATRLRTVSWNNFTHGIIHSLQTAATHNDKNEKREVVLSWKAPPNLKEQVTCR